MRLRTLIDSSALALKLPSIHAGGPGSGCRGENCGRHAGGKGVDKTHIPKSATVKTENPSGGKRPVTTGRRPGIGSRRRIPPKPDAPVKMPKPKFRKGDQVRYKDGIMPKGYHRETFEVARNTKATDGTWLVITTGAFTSKMIPEERLENVPTKK